MTKKVDRNRDYMYQMWGTTALVTDYGSENLLREVNHDELIPKNHNFSKQTELHERIRNDEDYDDWEYGTEPSYGKIIM